jgi:hypothetical protein
VAENTENCVIEILFEKGNNEKDDLIVLLNFHLMSFKLSHRTS